LLQQIPCAERADLTVPDISVEAPVEQQRYVLAARGSNEYFDHHSASQAFEHPCLRLHWDGAPEACTSILVDRHLQGRFRKWAIVAAFGDNLPASARVLAATIGMDPLRVEVLEQ